MQQVVKADNEQGQRGSKEHLQWPCNNNSNNINNNSLPYGIRKITETNTFKRHPKFYFFSSLFLHIGPGYGFLLYVMLSL